jgi:hypothetical protein
MKVNLSLFLLIDFLVAFRTKIGVGLELDPLRD